MNTSRATGFQLPHSATLQIQIHDVQNSSALAREEGSNESTPLLHEHKTLPPLTKRESTTAKWQMIALCWSLLLIGWGDASTGPLIPSIHEEYGVNFTEISYLFVAGCAGAVIGQFANMPLGDKFHLGTVLLLGSMLQLAGFVVQSFEVSYTTFILASLVSKFGVALENAQANAFVATLKNNQETKMGVLHAAYGFGALLAPISATFFAGTDDWQQHFVASAFLALCNIALLALVFGLKNEHECLIGAGETPPLESEDTDSSESKYSQIFRMKAVHLMAVFIIIYVGIEVTIGGWIVTFMLLERHGGMASGYVATGFFGGLTLGRIILLPLNRLLGEIRAIYVYTLFAILFQSIVWAVPSFNIGFCAVSVVGLLLGPMYPIVMGHAARVIPRPLVAGTIGWIGASGAAGATILPYFTGSLAEHYGIVALQPFTLVMMVVLAFLWMLVPKERHSRST